jgi:PadR family transcriptional regulator PadR
MRRADGVRLTRRTRPVLLVLMTGAAPATALGIAKAAGRPSGTVHPFLARLEQLGWVTSWWEYPTWPVVGSRRRRYLLTVAGRRSALALLGLEDTYAG